MYQADLFVYNRGEINGWAGRLKTELAHVSFAGIVIFIAISISVLSVLAGLVVSFYANLASGATIVLCAIFLFFLSFLASRLWSVR